MTPEISDIGYEKNSNISDFQIVLLYQYSVNSAVKGYFKLLII